jgi:tripartite-type tricarboxylate transporter receptor subunit TctC
MSKLRMWCGALLSAAMLLVAGAAQAQGQAVDYPGGPIRIIVPFAAGASNDAMGRLVAQQLTKRWGFENVVENITGAGGNVGANAAAKAAPDGKTLIVGSIGTHAVNMSLYGKMPYDTLNDFAPITLVAEVGLMVVVHPSLPFTSIPELIAYAKAHPGELNYASGGIGASQHLATELFMHMTGVKMIHVPYRGSAGSLADLLGGRVQLMFADIPLVMEHVQAGKLRAIGFAGSTRSAAMPEVKTVDEQGVTGYRATAWYGLFAPAKTPPAITGKLNETVVSILRAPDVRDYLVKIGAEPKPMTMDEFARFQRAESEKWGNLIRAIGIKIE